MATIPTTPVTKSVQSAPKWYAASLVTVVLLVGAYLFSANTGSTSYAPQAVMLTITVLTSASIFLHQIRNWHVYSSNQNVLKRELVLLIVAACLIPGATLLGDTNGAMHFGGSLDIPPINYFWMFLAVTSTLASFLAIANYIYFAMQNKHSFGAGFLRVAAWILYGLVWVVAAVISFVAYSLAYSAHDPSTE